MHSKRRILVVEDDASIRRGIVDSLEFEGYETREAATGNTGLDLAIRCDGDLLLLDLVLPERDGLEILAEARSARPTLPIIILTALGDEADRIRGLRLGADDYVVKPFSVRELLARVEAVLRRTPGRPMDVASIAIPGGLVDFAQSEVRFDDGRRAELTSRETDLLRYLANNAGRVVARDELLAHVWRISPHGSATRTIDMSVARLREKLDDTANQSLIRTVRGQGYCFCNES